MYNQNPKLRNTSSIGRTAQIHDYHMLHVAAWPTGVCAWSHILCAFGLPSIKAAEANYIMTQACLAAAIGRKKPAHLREPHPGYVNFMKILMLCLHPVPLQQFAVRVLLPLQQSIIGRLLAMLFFSCVCLMASMARSVNCLGQKNAVQVHLIGAKPIVQVKR